MNGNVRGLGNKRKLDLNIFIQMTVNSFAEQEGRTPRDWCDIVDAIFLHCNGDHAKCSLLERYRGSNIFQFVRFLLRHLYLTSKRCDDDAKQREPIFKQLIDIDSKNGKPGHLTGTLEKNLRQLLIYGDGKSGEDFSDVLCCLGNTSLNEANHARAIRRGYHTKGMTS